VHADPASEVASFLRPDGLFPGTKCWRSRRLSLLGRAFTGGGSVPCQLRLRSAGAPAARVARCALRLDESERLAVVTPQHAVAVTVIETLPKTSCPDLVAVHERSLSCRDRYLQRPRCDAARDSYSSKTFAGGATPCSLRSRPMIRERTDSPPATAKRLVVPSKWLRQDAGKDWLL
jgi:hypothetical protein